ncbi:MAG: hypothetical protein Q9P14_06725 [candidate division KSB1 bacterium]|nr:hypothetical protein [candidate division KSB1 bacterium]
MLPQHRHGRGEPRWQADAAVFQNLTLPAPVFNLALADLDDDGDADLILSDRQGRFMAFRNDRITSARSGPPVNSAALIRSFRIDSRRGAWHIRFRLTASGAVSIRIFDLLGRQVGELNRKLLPAGSHTLRYENPRLVHGLYFIRLEAGRQRWVQKALWVR